MPIVTPLPATANDITTASWQTATTTGPMAKPANVSDGDVLVALVYQQFAGSTITAPSGWTTQYFVTTPGSRGFYIFTKPIPTAVGETATTYTFTISLTGRGAAILFRIPSADTVTPLDAAPTSDFYGVPTASAITLPAVTAIRSNTLCLALIFANGTNNATNAFSATGFTLLADASTTISGGATSSIGVLYKFLPSSGTTGTLTVALTPSDSVTTAANAGGFLITLSGGSYIPIAWLTA